MNCKETKNLIVIGVYGRLTSAQRDELEEHISTCETCARLYEKSAPLMDLQPDGREITSLPDPENSWEVISSRTLGRSRLFSFTPVPKWAVAVCSLLIVFALGYLAGRRILGRSPQVLFAAATDPYDVSFVTYANNLKPVLVNFLNRDGVETPEKFRDLESRIIGDMLNQTRLLKGLAERGGDAGMLELLQDLEFILTAMSNVKPENRDVAVHLTRLIKEKQVPLRLQEFIISESKI
jgi:hypothetical protein